MLFLKLKSGKLLNRCNFLQDRAFQSAILNKVLHTLLGHELLHYSLVHFLFLF